MEKIYMEDYNNNRNKNHKSFISAILTLVIAVALVGGLIVFGFDSISYAAPTVTEDTFQFYTAQTGADPVALVAKTADGHFFNVPIYLANTADFTSATAIPVFCIEHHVDIDDPGSEYTKEDTAFNDAGLIYIFNKSGVLGGTGIISKETDDTNRYKETYATQVAIWLYMSEKYPEDSKYSLANYDDSVSAEANLNVIQNAVTMEVTLAGVSAIDISSLYSRIRKVVDDAKSATPVVKNININGGTSISMVGDDSFYQTSEMSVSSSSNDIVSYSVVVSGIDGAFVVNKDGEAANSFGPADTFFVRVPVQNVTTSTADIEVSVNALFNNYVNGSYYKRDGFQRVAVVTSNQAQVPKSKSISIVKTPNTGMNKTQTIYFIGLVVLLCGVGIIYANAKQNETE